MRFGKLLFRRKRRPDRGALERLLSAPVPDGTAAVPFQRALPLPRATTDVFGHLVLAVSVLVFGTLRFDIAADVFAVLLILAGLLLVAAAALLGGGLDSQRRMYVSDAGIRIDRVFGSIEIPWWQVRAISAAPDLSKVMIDAGQHQLHVDLAAFDEEARGAVVDALRARLPDGVDIQAWDEPRINRSVATHSLAILGSVALVGSIFVEARGGALGVRCSGPSAYLSARFDVPRQPGCVFIRVSGQAKRAGIRRGDQMIAMDGVPVTSGPQFNGLFDAHRGDQFIFRVVRSGTHVTEDVKVSFGPSGHIDAPADDPITHFLAAKSDLARHPDFGIREYSKAIELAPDFDLAYVGRAQLYEKKGDDASAAADFRKAIELDPDLAEALRGLAALLASPYDRPTYEALDLAVRAVMSDGCNVQIHEHNSDCASDYSTYADLVLRLGDIEGAIARAKEALRFDPAEGHPHAVLAWAYATLGDLDLARAELKSYRAWHDGSSETVHAIETRIATASLGESAP